MVKLIWGFLCLTIFSLQLFSMGLLALRCFCTGLISEFSTGCLGDTLPVKLCRKYYGGMLPLAFIMLLATSPSPSYGQAYSASYDSYIQYAVDRYWSDFPYPWAWKAQLYQESRLNPKAVSPVGAKGLAQFMPGTWDQVTRDLGWGNVSPFSPKHSVIAGAHYMKTLRGKWHARRTVWDRHWLAAASYNGGLGNILAAQVKCSGAPAYDAVMRCLPLITGKHSRETIGYTEFIARHWSRMAPGVKAYSRTLEAQ